MYESDDDWEEKVPAPKRRKSTGLPVSTESRPAPVVKETNIQLPKKYVKPWTKVIGTAVFEIYDYGNSNNNNVTKLNNNVTNYKNGNKTSSGNDEKEEQGRLTVNGSNDISSSLTTENGRQVVNNNTSCSSNTSVLERRSWSSPYTEAAPTVDSASSTTICSSSAPPRLVFESIDNGSATSSEAASSIVRNGDYNAESEAENHRIVSDSASTNGEDFEQKQQQYYHKQDHPHPHLQHYQCLQHCQLQTQHQLISQLQQPKPATQHCNNNCAALNDSTCSKCAFRDNATKREEGGDACHKISPRRSTDYHHDNDWCISPLSDVKDAVNDTTEGIMKGQDIGSLPLSPASLSSVSESEEETKSPSLLSGNKPLTLEVPSPTLDSKGWYLSPGSGGVSPSEDRWWRVPPKKRWLPHTGDYHGQVLVTDVTCNCVTVTFMESSTDKGFFKEYTDE